MKGSSPALVLFAPPLLKKDLGILLISEKGLRDSMRYGMVRGRAAGHTEDEYDVQISAEPSLGPLRAGYSRRR